MKMIDIISRFSGLVAQGEVEIYNEFSLQHELGIYLRSQLENKKVQFERNISFFGLEKSEAVKREIDIAVFASETAPDVAIELKYPRNGQHPEQMFKFCEDVQFAEQLRHSKFKAAYVVIFAEDHLFYEGNKEGIYGFFRGGKSLHGAIAGPTANSKGKIVTIEGHYAIKWQPVAGSLKYTIIDVG